MKATVDTASCAGCSLCADSCPDVFEMNDEGLALAKAEEVPSADEGAAKDAADNCPAGAITVE